MDTHGMLFFFLRINVPTTSYSIRTDMVTKLEKRAEWNRNAVGAEIICHLNSLRKRLLSCRTDER